MGNYDFNCGRSWIRATYLMVIGRSQMRQQITKPPQKRKWSSKRKRSINCKRPRGFSERAHCAGRKKRKQ